MTQSRVRNAQSLSAGLKSTPWPARDARVRVSMRASVQLTAERCISAQVLELSREGFRVIAKEPLQSGQRVELLTGKEASFGEIRWVDGLEAGGVFLGSSAGG